MSQGLAASVPAARGIPIRLERFVPPVMIIVVLLAAMLSITPWPVGVFQDDAIYTVLAKALATGEGYHLINLPDAPHATHFPPGYPFLLSLLWRVSPEFPDNVAVFKFANAMLVAVAAAGAYWFARSRLAFGSLAAAGVAIVGMASSLMLQLAGLVLSEPLFLALLFPALMLVEKSADDGQVRTAVLAGLLLGALSMVRTLGAVAVGAAFLVLLLRRRPAAAIALAMASSLFLVPWQLWVSTYQGETPAILMGKYGAYGPWLLDGYRDGGLPFARAVVLENLAWVGNHVSYLFFPGPQRWPRILSLLVLAPFMIGGLAVLVRRAPTLVAFLTFYLGVIIVWPFDPYRFIIAVWPVLVLVVVTAIRAMWTWMPHGGAPRVFRLAALGAVACLGVGHAAYNWEGYTQQTWTRLQQQAGESARPLLEWVVEYTGPNDVLASEHDLEVYLYTGRRGVPTSTFLARQHVRPFTPAEVERWVHRMLDTFEPRYFATGYQPRVAAAESLTTRTPPVLRRLGTLPHHVVYERVAP